MGHTFVLKRQEATAAWRQLLYNSFMICNQQRVAYYLCGQNKEGGRQGHVARMEEVRNTYKPLVVIVERKSCKIREMGSRYTGRDGTELRVLVTEI
jgi:hypothetical protein